MATGAFYLYVAGGILLSLGFAAHVVHAVLLASGRRLAAALGQGRRPAFAGVVTGSFAESGAAHRVAAAADAPRSAAGPYAIGLSYAALATLAASLLLRGLAVGRGPWGNLYEFTVAFAFGVALGYLVLERRYPIRSLGFLPLGVALTLFVYSATDFTDGKR